MPIERAEVPIQEGSAPPESVRGIRHIWQKIPACVFALLLVLPVLFLLPYGFEKGPRTSWWLRPLLLLSAIVFSGAIRQLKLRHAVVALLTGLPVFAMWILLQPNITAESEFLIGALAVTAVIIGEWWSVARKTPFALVLAIISAMLGFFIFHVGNQYMTWVLPQWFSGKTSQAWPVMFWLMLGLSLRVGQIKGRVVQILWLVLCLASGSGIYCLHKSGYAPRPWGESVEFLAQKLQSSNLLVRHKAIYKLAEIGGKEVIEPLIQSLNDNSAQIRRQAAIALGYMKDKRATKPLLPLLNDTENDVRLMAMWALGKIGDPEASQPLLEALKNEEDPTTRAQIVYAIGRTKNKTALEPLLELLASALPEGKESKLEFPRRGTIYPPFQMPIYYSTVTAIDEGMRPHVIWALGEIGDMRASKSVKELLADDFVNIRGISVVALGKMGDKESFPEMSALLRDDDPYVRWSAAIGLGELADKRAVENLIQALNDSNVTVVQRVILSLGRIGDGQAVEPLISFLGHEQPEVANFAAAALGELKDERAIEPLLDVIKNAERVGRSINVQMIHFYTGRKVSYWSIGDHSVRLGAIHALGMIGDQRAIEPLIGLLASLDTNIRASAVQALGILGDRRTVEPIENILQEDQDESVRAAAASALGRIGAAEAVETLIRSLRDRMSPVRVSAATALGDIGDERAVEPLKKSLKDRRPDVRRATAEALEKLGHKP